MASLPTLFISHGSPATVLNPGKVGEALSRLAAELPTPTAIVMASAHFETRQPVVGSATQPATIHDFNGFPEALYQMRYQAPGSPQMAERISGLLARAGFQPRLDPARGFDHGVWEPLAMLYPQANIPVIPLSIQPHQDPHHHLQLGRALASLREEGMLLIGSGSITHNLADVFGRQKRSIDYVEPFIGWIEERLAANDIEAMLDYRQRAPYAEQAHPTDEHLLPLYFAMGAASANELNAQRIDAGIDAGVLAMDIYRFEGNSAMRA